MREISNKSVESEPSESEAPGFESLATSGAYPRDSIGFDEFHWADDGDKTEKIVLDSHAFTQDSSIGAPSDVGTNGAGPIAVEAAEPPAPPPIRYKHCTESWSTASGVHEICGAVLGDDVRCSVCDGARCYAHCGSIDHYTSAEPYAGGTSDDGRLRWRMSITREGLYLGHVATMGLSPRVLMKTAGADAEVVMQECVDFAATAAPEEHAVTVEHSEPPASDAVLLRRHGPLAVAVTDHVLTALAGLPRSLLDALSFVYDVAPDGLSRRFHELPFPSHLAEIGTAAERAAVLLVAELDNCSCDRCRETLSRHRIFVSELLNPKAEVR